MTFNQMNQQQYYRGMNPGGKVLVRRPPQPGQQSGTPAGGKLMRLKCRFRPLQDTYLVNGEITERDADIVFVCSDGKVRAHKIILASSSLLLGKVFEDQKSGKMTTVVVPDITTEIMSLVVALTYHDSVNMTHKQVKEVGGCLNIFGMNWKQFNCNDPQNPGVSVSLGTKSEPQANPTIRQQTQDHQMRQIQQQRMQQQYQRKLISGQLQGQNQGQVTMKQMSAAGLVFKGGQPVGRMQGQGPPPLQKARIVTQNQEGQISDGSDQSDYKFQVQGYSHAQVQGQRGQSQGMHQQVQVRPLKQLLSGGHVQMQGMRKPPQIGHQVPGEGMRGFRKIAPKPLPQHGEGEMDLYGGVADQLEIQMETGDSNEEDNATLDQESGQMKINEWIQNVGRDNSSLSHKKPTISAMPVSSQVRPGQIAPNASANQCLICNNIFDDESKWHWHETHHVGLGIFKCEFCDELFSTSRKVFQHEMMEHGVTTKDGPVEPPAIPEDFQIVNGRKRKLGPPDEAGPSTLDYDPERMTLVRTVHGTHFRKLPGSPGPSMKRKIALSKLSRANLVNNLRARNPLIQQGIDHAEEDDGLEGPKKIRQLHWIYVCSQCEHGVDSSQKAQLHYQTCYAGQVVPFESTVMKYRQGYYGKVKCPICPRRYTSAAGFKIHCGHMHVEYRKKFSHSNTDDSIVCRNCKKRFTDPVDFHYHLSDGECYDAPEFNKEEAVAGEGRWVGNGTPGEGEENNGPPKLKKEKISPVAAATPVPTAAPATPAAPAPATPATPAAPPAPHSSSSLSRSTRLTNRILMNSEDGGENGENKFPAVTCPVCGTPAIQKIVEHLQTEHSDLDVLVSRVANALLRCQKCRITFSLCDLLAHMNNCAGTKQFQYVSERRAAQAGSKARVSGPTQQGTSIPIPPGIGESPVDKIECEDLTSVETLKAAMHCGVCGKNANKLGIIADCLRGHGINRCALCFNTYKDKAVYSNHLRQAHGAGPGRLSCPLCPKHFMNAGQVAGHMYSSHWLTILKDQSIAQGNGPVANKTEEHNDILAAVGLTAATTPATARTSEDYSNITLGSILQSSENAYKIDKKGEEEKSSDEATSTKEGEEEESKEAEAEAETQPGEERQE